MIDVRLNFPDDKGAGAFRAALIASWFDQAGITYATSGAARAEVQVLTSTVASLPAGTDTSTPASNRLPVVSVLANSGAMAPSSPSIANAHTVDFSQDEQAGWDGLLQSLLSCGIEIPVESTALERLQRLEKAQTKLNPLALPKEAWLALYKHAQARRKRIRADVGLADALVVAKELELSDAHWIQAAKMLGFSAQPSTRSRGAKGVQDRRAAKHKPNAPTHEPEREEGSMPPPPTSLESPPEKLANPRLRERSRVDFSTAESPAWLRQPIDTPLPDAPPPFRGLLTRRAERAVLSAAIANWVPGRTPDLTNLVQRIARGEVVASLPTRLVPTLRDGVQFLSDGGEAMHPFRIDLDHLKLKLESLFARTALETYSFADNPLSARGPRHQNAEGKSTRTPWAPVAGRPVLVATAFGRTPTFGGTDEALINHWATFAERCREAGCAVVALNPYGRHHWPAWLNSHLRVVHWAASTRAAAVVSLNRNSRHLARDQ